MDRASHDHRTQPRMFNRNFLLVMQGALVSQMGDQIAYVATVYWLRQTTDSASLVGLLASTAAIPLLLLSPVGGVAADRWQRLRVLILCDLICCLLSLYLMFLCRHTGSVGAWVIPGIFLGKLLMTACTAFTNPALNALIPDVVDRRHLEKAIGFSQAASLVAIIGGQALGALLLEHFSPPVLFAINAATYLVSALAESRVRTTAPAAPPATAAAGHALSFWRDIRDATDYIWQRPGMRLLLMAALPVSIFSDAVLVFLPFYTTNALGMSLPHYPYLLSVFSTGLLLGYFAGSRLRIASAWRSQAVIGCILINATLFVGLSLIHAYALALPAILLFGCCSGAISLLSMNALISQTEPGKRGRVAAVLMMITQGLTPLSMGLFGVAGDLLQGNLRPLYACCGLALLIVGASLLPSRNLRYFFQGASSAPS